MKKIKINKLLWEYLFDNNFIVLYKTVTKSIIKDTVTTKNIKMNKEEAKRYFEYDFDFYNHWDHNYEVGKVDDVKIKVNQIKLKGLVFLLEDEYKKFYVSYNTIFISSFDSIDEHSSIDFFHRDGMHKLKVVNIIEGVEF